MWTSKLQLTSFGILICNTISSATNRKIQLWIVFRAEKKTQFVWHMFNSYYSIAHDNYLIFWQLFLVIWLKCCYNCYRCCWKVIYGAERSWDSVSYLCCSMHGYWHEAIPALQSGKSLWNAEAVVHRLPGCSWQPGNYAPSWKPGPLLPAGKICLVMSFIVEKYATLFLFTGAIQLRSSSGQI